MKRFKAKGYSHEPILINNLEQRLDFSQLPAFLRTLLVTDGTVTKCLEAFYWEPVQVQATEQELIMLEADNPALSVAAGAEVLMRHVKLVGEHSQTCYAQADSVIAINNLPDQLSQALKSGEIGIGELLREKNLATYREIIDIFQAQTDYISRTYRILIEQLPAIQVTEHFPLAVYQTP